MNFEHLRDALASLEKVNADLEPELLSAPDARAALAAYARAEKLVAYGKAALARRVDDAALVAKATGTSVGKAKTVLETGKALRDSEVVSDALAGGSISLDQASEIARAEQAAPGAGSELLRVARDESFQVLRERSRKVVLEAAQTRGLGERQREARAGRSHTGDELGMVNIHLRLQPHVGAPLVSRAEAEAQRRYRAAKAAGRQEPFERHLADAYAALLSGGPVAGNPKRPELVVLVSHEVATRGWRDVREGEVCKIPGMGPVPPEVVRDEIAPDAFLTGVFFDGQDLRHMRRWTRNTPVEVRLALELGEPPDFDGVRCVECGKRFRNQHDHLEPHSAGGCASTDNLRPLCYSCHQAKTERDRRAGKLRPRGKPSLACRRSRGRVVLRGPPMA